MTIKYIIRIMTIINVLIFLMVMLVDSTSWWRQWSVWPAWFSFWFTHSTYTVGRSFSIISSFSTSDENPCCCTASACLHSRHRTWQGEGKPTTKLLTGAWVTFMYTEHLKMIRWQIKTCLSSWKYEHLLLLLYQLFFYTKKRQDIYTI
jgi:hypothetical protein